MDTRGAGNYYSGVSIAGAGLSVLGNITGNVEYHVDDSRVREEIRCLRALFATDPEDDRARYISFKGRVIPKTCNWLIENQTYKTWFDPAAECEILWISGGPGTGKTMLSIFLTQQLERLKLADAVVLYYFCEGRDAKRNNAINILRGIIYSLVRRRKKLIKHLLTDFEVQDEALFSSNSIEALWRIFEKMISDPETGPVYCIIDGLDECNRSSPEHLEHIVKKIKNYFLEKLDSDERSHAEDIGHLTQRVQNAPISQNDQNKSAKKELSGQNTSQGKSENSVQISPIFKLAVISREQPILLLNELSCFPRVQLGGAVTVQPQGNTESDTNTSGALSDLIPVNHESLGNAISGGRNAGGVTRAPTVSKAAHRSQSLKQKNEVAENYSESLLIYVKEKVGELAEARGQDIRWRNHLQDAFVRCSNGNFLWVDLALAELRKAESQELVQLLLQLPTKIEDMYSRILLRIPPERVLFASFMIRWVTTAFQPLKIEEILAAWALATQRSGEKMVGDIEKAMESFKSLFVTNADGEISLLHETTKHFLAWDDSPVQKDVRLAPFFMSEKKSHAELADTCLEYLESGCLASGPVHLFSGSDRQNLFGDAENWTADVEVLQQFPLLPYAALNWTEHLRHAYPAQVNLSSAFFSSGSIIRKNWWKSVFEATTSEPADHATSRFSLLHLAAYFDLRVIVEQLAQRNDLMKRLEKRNVLLFTPLFVAAERGSANACTILFDYGANPYMFNLHVIHLAAQYGHVEIVKRMLGSGVDVNLATMPDSRMIKGLKTTARALVRFSRLREMISNISTDEEKDNIDYAHLERGQCESSLHLALWAGHEAVVKLLLDLGANVNQQTRTGWTPIHFASFSGQTVLINMIISHGGDVSAVTEKGWLGLHVAAYRGRPEAIQAFIDMGNPVNAADFSDTHMTPLHLASSQGQLQAVQLLLDNGASIEAVDAKGQTALHHATLNSHQTVVAELLNRGAYRGAKAQNGKNAWKMAKAGSMPELANFLVTYKPAVVLPHFRPSTLSGPGPNPPNWQGPASTTNTVHTLASRPDYESSISIESLSIKDSQSSMLSISPSLHPPPLPPRPKSSIGGMQVTSEPVYGANPLHLPALRASKSSAELKSPYRLSFPARIPQQPHFPEDRPVQQTTGISQSFILSNPHLPQMP